MANVEDLGKLIKIKYPGKYEDLTDTDLGLRIKAKYPQYSDFEDKPKQVSASQKLDIESAARYNPSFPAKAAEETAISAPFKTLGNIPSSAFNFAKNVLDVLNPISTAKKVIEIGKEAKEFANEVGGGKAALETVKGLPKATYEGLVPEFFQSIGKGDTENALRTIINDPFGQIAPILLLARGAAERSGKGAQFDATITKLTEPIIKATTAPFKVAGKVATKTLGITTGVGEEGIKTAFQGGSEFKDAM